MVGTRSDSEVRNGVGLQQMGSAFVRRRSFDKGVVESRGPENMRYGQEESSAAPMLLCLPRFGSRRLGARPHGKAESPAGEEVLLHGLLCRCFPCRRLRSLLLAKGLKRQRQCPVGRLLVVPGQDRKRRSRIFSDGMRARRSHASCTYGAHCNLARNTNRTLSSAPEGPNTVIEANRFQDQKSAVWRCEARRGSLMP